LHALPVFATLSPTRTRGLQVKIKEILIRYIGNCLKADKAYGKGSPTHWASRLVSYRKRVGLTACGLKGIRGKTRSRRIRWI